ncbi:hypothetical protein HDU97_003904 [Phlyctochytrium planicorne]|nr:hypothetical protein HDU97_003904 [Phlyctochytrium planicorne]
MSPATRMPSLQRSDSEESEGSRSLLRGSSIIVQNYINSAPLIEPQNFTNLPGDGIFGRSSARGSVETDPSARNSAFEDGVARQQLNSQETLPGSQDFSSADDDCLGPTKRRSGGMTRDLISPAQAMASSSSASVRKRSLGSMPGTLPTGGDLPSILAQPQAEPVALNSSVRSDNAKEIDVDDSSLSLTRHLRIAGHHQGQPRVEEPDIMGLSPPLQREPVRIHRSPSHSQLFPLGREQPSQPRPTIPQRRSSLVDALSDSNASPISSVARPASPSQLFEILGLEGITGDVGRNAARDGGSSTSALYSSVLQTQSTTGALAQDVGVGSSKRRASPANEEEEPAKHRKVEDIVTEEKEKERATELSQQHQLQKDQEKPQQEPQHLQPQSSQSVEKFLRDEMLEDLQCAICVDVMVCPMSINPCGHTFCGPCIDDWFRAGKRTCPNCRQRVSKSLIPQHMLEGTINKMLTKLGQDESDKKERADREKEWKERRAKTNGALPEPDPQPAQRTALTNWLDRNARARQQNQQGAQPGPAFHRLGAGVEGQIAAGPARMGRRGRQDAGAAMNLEDGAAMNFDFIDVAVRNNNNNQARQWNGRRR